MAYYQTVYTNGDSSGARWMTIYLYPQSDVVSACKPDGVVSTALRDAGDDLLGSDAIDYYEILRFKVENYNAPDSIDPTDGTDTDFKEYLNDNGTAPDNGTGENLYTQVGVHELIHSNQNACDEDSEGYAPAGANGEPSGVKETAFTEGLVSWSPVCDVDDGLTRNAAIQEAMHQFIGKAWDDEWTETTTEDEDDDQHTLGRVYKFNLQGYVTPMLTYHWDDDDLGDGDCPQELEHASEHDQSLTSCTEAAIEKSACEDLHLEDFGIQC